MNTAITVKRALAAMENTAITPPAPVPTSAMDQLLAVPLRFLADTAATAALFDRVSDGKLIDFVKAAPWSTPGRRQYAIGCAAKVEQYRLIKRVFRDDTFADQVIPLYKTGVSTPGSVRAAARKLQSLAAQEMRLRSEATLSPEVVAALAEVRSKVSPRADIAPSNIELLGIPAP